MPRKTDRRPLTAVRLRGRGGTIHDFDSLDDFVRHLPRGYGGVRLIETLGRRFVRLSYVGGFAIRGSDGINDGEDRTRILEDLWGDPIPREQVYAAWRAAHGARPEIPFYTRFGVPGRNYRHRLDPVPGTRCARGGGKMDRHVRTTQEIRAWEDLHQADAEGEIHRIKARRKRAPRNLPDLYDDPPFARRGNNWKNHRRTQYRPVDKTGRSD